MMMLMVVLMKIVIIMIALMMMKMKMKLKKATAIRLRGSAMLAKGLISPAFLFRTFPFALCCILHVLITAMLQTWTGQ